MKRSIIITSLLSLILFPSFGQKPSRPNDSIFINGIHFDKPNFNFKWDFLLSEIPADKFQNFQVQKRWRWAAEIKFDSVVIFDDIVFKNVIVKCLHKKNEEQYKITEFIGVVDLVTLDKLETFFDYKYLGWITYPKSNPKYKFRLYKEKKFGAILIDRFGKF